MKNPQRLAITTVAGFRGAPVGIRTLDLLIRSQTLYPAELRAHFLMVQRLDAAATSQ